MKKMSQLDFDNGASIKAYEMADAKLRGIIRQQEFEAKVLDAIFKGMTYINYTDDTADTIKKVPEGSMEMAILNSIGGATQSWSQIAPVQREVSYVESSNNVRPLTLPEDGIEFIKGHVYMISCTQSDSMMTNTRNAIGVNFGSGIIYESQSTNYNLGAGRRACVMTANASTTTGGVYVWVSGSDVPVSFSELNIVDLTECFGAGNEPSTPEGAYASGVPKYISGVGTGIPSSAKIDKIIIGGANLLPLSFEQIGSGLSGMAFTTYDASQHAFVRDAIASLGKFAGKEVVYTCTKTGEDLSYDAPIGTLEFYKGYTKVLTLVPGEVCGVLPDVSDADRIRIYGGSNAVASKFMVTLGGKIIPYAEWIEPVEIDIPEAVVSLQGYGESNGDKVNTVDLGELVFHRYGYYNESRIWIDDTADIDISDILPVEFAALDVHPNGTISFVQSNGTEVAMPSSITYIIKLNEVV